MNPLFDENISYFYFKHLEDRNLFNKNLRRIALVIFTYMTKIIAWIISY